MKGYTPGPWKVHTEAAKLITAKNKAICMMRNTHAAEENVANARLIAEAPELLRVLEEIVALEYSYNGACWSVEVGYSALITQAKDVIARGKGKD